MPDELSGAVIVDKPAGMTSAQVVAQVKRLFGAKKAGHTGTLDPFATGVLVCCLNRATRISRFLLEGDKTYLAEMVLGARTDTQDATGTVTARDTYEGVTGEAIRKTALRFVGQIAQVPPAYSALKHRGTPLYKLARQGQRVEKPARPVRIHRLHILAVELPVVTFEVACSAGTYIRTLCADMGQALGCGGHLGRLRRTASCGFTIADACSLETLSTLAQDGRLEDVVVPMRDALPFMPEWVADSRLAAKVQKGIRLDGSDFPQSPPVSGEADFKIVDTHGRLLAVMHATAAGDYNYCCVFSA
jgi:tRNA pseudouridine55 synthase